MLKIITVIGARPQIIKAAALSRAIKNHFADKINEIIVHTGQHYDENMSAVFFEELGIPEPNYNLNVGSGNHAKQTAAMMLGLEEIIEKEKPNALVLYGDTNSTLAGAVVASKLRLPIAHVEAGLRSFNKSMPEEINRIMCDHVSTLLFSPTDTGFQNLLNEGFKADTQAPYNSDNPKIYHCGDVMYDNSLFFADIAEKKTDIISRLQLEKGKFILGTIHRDNNTDNPERLNALFEAFLEITTSNKTALVLPLHPRTSKLLPLNLDKDLYSAVLGSNDIMIVPPVSFLEMIVLEKNAQLIMTDSGGVQKEAFFFQKPCIILRPETEWVELVKAGTARVTDANKQNIIDAYNHFSMTNNLQYPQLYGNGKAAEFICSEMIKNIN